MKYSVVKYRDIAKNFDFRIDAEYFKPEYLTSLNLIKTKNFKFLCDCTKIKGGKRLPPNENFSSEGVPYIRAEDIKENFVEYHSSPKISLKLHKLLKNYQTTYNDVLITIVGNSIGDAGIVKYVLDKCNLTENCAKIIAEQDLFPEYLFIFLRSKFGRYQIVRETVGTAQPKLALVRIKQFQIPILNKNFQLVISESVNNANNNIEKSKNFYLEAQKLLLKDLNIIDWQAANNFSYIKNYSDVQNANRLDAEYFQPKYDEILKTIKKYSNGYDALEDIVDIKKCIEVGSEEYRENGIPFIRVSNLSKYEINENNQQCISEKKYEELKKEYQPQKGEILLSKDGTAGIAFYINDNPKKMIPSGGILRLTIKNPEYLPEYLTLVLNSVLVQQQIERTSSGALIQHWLIDEINNTIIPKLEKSKQQEIVQKIQESFNCRNQSKQLLEIAKRGVEIAIEQDETIATNWINNELQKIGVEV